MVQGLREKDESKFRDLTVMALWRGLDVYLVGCIAGIVGSLLVYSIVQVRFDDHSTSRTSKLKCLVYLSHWLPKFST